MNTQRVIRHWVKTAKMDVETAEILFKSKKYTHALFFGHLALEKIFKACYVQTKGTHAPFTHDLVKLAREADISLPSEKEGWLPEINTFNIRARYMDIKLKFHKKCTSSFTRKHFNRIKEIYKWLLQSKKL